MSLAARIDVSGHDAVAGYLARLRGSLSDPTILNRSIAGYAETLTRQHLTTLAGTRHATANRLGAQPTGHLARAAESVVSEGNAEAAVVSVVSPGIRRAFADVTIKPKTGKYLTIPATAEAYGRRARSFNDLRLVAFKGGSLLALVKAEQSDLASRRRSGFEADQGEAGLGWKKRATIYFWLKTEVTQKQDRTLLPPDDDYASAAREGIKAYLRMLRAAASA